MKYVPLEQDLQHWFDCRLNALPPTLRRRIKLELPVHHWDDLTPDERRSLARQVDYQKDPNLEPHQVYWFNFYVDMETKKDQLAEWRLMKSPTPTEKVLQENRIAALSAEIDHMRRLERLWMARAFPQHEASMDDAQLPVPTPTSVFLAFPRALQYLKEKFASTTEELAAWVYIGPRHGGLRAYKSARHGRIAARFFFEPEMNADYVSEMLGCHFLEEELNSFMPSERYITGAALKRLWAKQLGKHVEDLIRRFSEQGKLIEVHPTRGAVATDASGERDLPALETGLFPLGQVEHLQHSVLDIEYPLSVPATTERPAARKARLQVWFDEEVALRGKRGALTRAAQREAITTQTLRKILDRPKK